MPQNDIDENHAGPGYGENDFNFFNSPKSLLKWWKQPPVDHLGEK